MGILSKIEALLQGKKTYIVGILIGVVAVLQYYGVAIPEFAWTLLAAIGLGAVRSAIQKSGTTP